jgi:putative lipoprotein
MTKAGRRSIAVGLVALAACQGSTGAQPASPVGAWRAEDIRGEPIAPGVDSTLEIAPDGAVTGSGGCNRYRGRATLGEGTIAFSPLAATRMACPGPAMAQEQRFFAALAAARAFRIADGALLLLADDGAMLASFVRGA